LTVTADYEVLGSDRLALSLSLSLCLSLSLSLSLSRLDSPFPNATRHLTRSSKTETLSVEEQCNIFLDFNLLPN